MLLLLLLPIIAISQVGINTTTPTATLHVMGNLKIKASQGAVTDSILVIRNNEVMKVAVSEYYVMQPVQSVCPDLQRSQSSGYHLLFKSNSSIENPNSAITIQGISFVSAGTWISNNEYFFSYSNTTGTPLNINSPFTVSFGSQICEY